MSLNHRVSRPDRSRGEIVGVGSVADAQVEGSVRGEMESDDSAIPVLVRVGGLTRSELRAALDELGVRTNESAEVLLRSEIFDRPGVDVVRVVRRTVRQLGFGDGASLSSIYARALELGLQLCPAISGPYLRLVMDDQTSAPDSVMSTGSAPTGSITVAAAPLGDDDFPKGFYLRAVDGVLWLRGYHATDEHLWSPQDCFVFREEPTVRP